MTLTAAALVGLTKEEAIDVLTVASVSNPLLAARRAEEYKSSRQAERSAFWQIVAELKEEGVL